MSKNTPSKPDNGKPLEEMTAADFEPGGLADWVADETPIGRWTQPGEIAELTFMLAGGKLASMQGQIITIDGGWSLK